MCRCLRNVCGAARFSAVFVYICNRWRICIFHIIFIESTLGGGGGRVMAFVGAKTKAIRRAMKAYLQGRGAQLYRESVSICRLVCECVYIYIYIIHNAITQCARRYCGRGLEIQSLYACGEMSARSNDTAQTHIERVHDEYKPLDCEPRRTHLHIKSHHWLAG